MEVEVRSRARGNANGKTGGTLLRENDNPCPLADVSASLGGV
jgi:hypothetical protein